MSSVTRKPQAHRHRRPWHMVWQDEMFKRCWRKHTGKPAIAQLVEHLTVELCSYQVIPGSIPVGRIFSCDDLIQLLRTTHDRSTMPDTKTSAFFSKLLEETWMAHMQGGAKSTSCAHHIMSLREQLLTPPVASGISRARSATKDTSKHEQVASHYEASP